MSYEKLLLLPVFAHVAMILASVYRLGFSRVAAVRRGDVKVKDIALDPEKWPDELRKRANNYRNQFELPVLFYLLTILTIITRQADLLFVLLAWVFVLLRVFQALVHVTSNNVRYRGAFFGAGAIVLLIMWIIFMVRFLLGGVP